MTAFDNVFEKLKVFDAMPDKPQHYLMLQALLEDYTYQTHEFTEHERLLLGYILSERAYSQAYEMGYSKDYETSELINVFSEKRLKSAKLF